MPGTIKDDTSAKSIDLAVTVFKSKSGRNRNSARFLDSNGRFSTDAPLPGTIHRITSRQISPVFITLLIIAASFGLAERAQATIANCRQTYPHYANCWSTLRTSYPYTSPVSETGINKCLLEVYGYWCRHYNSGDYIDKRWYHYLDEGQYYYLDDTQYKLMGGLNYILGHPCYPKLFEWMSDQQVGFRDGRGINWLALLQEYRIAGGPCDAYITPVSACWFMGLRNCFNSGDYIDKWRYCYLDKGRYKTLEVMQYKWLGGLAYLYESFHWYSYSFP